MKTPEQLAEEYASKIYRLKYYVDGRLKPRQGQEGLRWLAGKNGFLAGYQAAKDEILSKGMQSYITEIRNDAWCTAMQLGQQSQWISVKERLPEEGEEVLVFGQYLNDIPKVLGVRSRYKGDQDWKYTWEGSDEWVYRENDVTHWMPLPEAPKDE